MAEVAEERRLCKDSQDRGCQAEAAMVEAAWGHGRGCQVEVVLVEATWGLGRGCKAEVARVEAATVEAAKQRKFW